MRQEPGGRAGQGRREQASGVGDAAGTTGDPDPFASTFAAWLDGDLSARIPGGESGVEVVARYREVLDEVADAHRGESVLVVSHGGVMCLALAVLAAAMDDAARAAFDGLAPSHKKEWVRWVEEAKKAETRTARIAKTVEGLKAGKKTH